MAKDFIAEELSQIQEKYLLTCVYPYSPKNIFLSRGKRTQLMDTKGKIYTDFFSGVVNCGHCHPEITSKITESADRHTAPANIHVSESMIRLAERLGRILPAELDKIFFFCSSSEANEGAAILARIKTGRNKLMSLQNSYHGNTFLTLGLSDLNTWGSLPFSYPDIVHAPAPFTMNLSEVERVIKDNKPEEIAAFFVEPIQVPGGIVIPLNEYLAGLRDILNRYGILMVADESYTGFCRSGRWFCIEHAHVVPDIITGSNSLANGLPIAFLAVAEKFTQGSKWPGSPAFGVNPIMCEASLATLDFMEKNQMAEKAAVSGRYLENGLAEIKRDFQKIKSVRGRGLMVGMEVDTRGNPEIVELILEDMRSRGFLIGKTGEAGNVLTFLPPLIITAKEITTMLESLRKSFEKYA